MDKCINIRRFMEMFFDDQQAVQPATEIGQAILTARSFQLADLTVKMKGNPAVCYNRIQRFLKRNDGPRSSLAFVSGASRVCDW